MPSRDEAWGFVSDRNCPPGMIADLVGVPMICGLLLHHASCISVAQKPGIWETQGLPVNYFLASPATPAIETQRVKGEL